VYLGEVGERGTDPIPISINVAPIMAPICRSVTHDSHALFLGAPTAESYVPGAWVSSQFYALQRLPGIVTDKLTIHFIGRSHRFCCLSRRFGCMTGSYFALFAGLSVTLVIVASLTR
jgi:hypothetical protein